jgi:antitoxin MazE
MEARLVKIGNSKGIRLPKAMLQQTGMTEWIEIEAKGGNIILKPIKQPRSGWEESFAQGGDKLNAEDRAWLNAELVSVEGESW